MAYREQLTLKAKGLHKYSDSLSSVPEGSLKTASNVVLDKDDIIKPRRGFETLPGAISGTINSLHSYTLPDGSDILIAHRNDTNLSRYDDGSETWTDYAGTYSAPASSGAIRSAEANKNIYFATSKGVQKLDEAAGTIVDAGAPEALTIEPQATPFVAGSAVSNNQYVGYRALWGYRDANDNLILGSPSASVVMQNTSGGVADGQVRAYIPISTVTTAWFVQLYRTLETGTADVGEQYQLVLERNPTGSDITNGYIDMTDSTPEAFLGAELYTNPTQEGIINSNYQPPQCVDMALFQGHMFYANTESKYEFTATIGSEFPLDGIITVNSVVYTAKAAEDIGNNYFQHSSTVSGTAAQQVEGMAKSLAKVINASASNTTLYAVYDSLENELPGRFRIYERDYGDATAFTIASSDGDKFVPPIVGTETATNNKYPNRLFYSKIQEPWAVPLLNYFEVGPANDRILRIIPLRSTLLIFTTRAIYRMTGTSSNTFQVTLLDNTARLLAPESLVSINNTACGLFDQGVSTVSGSAVQIISRPIEGDILDIRGAAGAKLAELGFGVSYESDRKYLLALPQSDTATTNTIFYVYNTATNSWTTYDLSKLSGIVRPGDDKLYLAESDRISRERKDFGASDYAEESIAVNTTAVSVDKLTLTLTDVSSAVVGYLYYETSSKYSVVSAVDTLASTITVQDPLDWATGAAEFRPFIETTIVWNPISAKSPNVLKQWAECSLLVETPVQDADLSFSTQSSGGFESVTLTDSAIGPWGLFPWGDVGWGGDPFRTRYRTYVPRNKQKDTYINVKLEQRTVYNAFEVSGLSLFYRIISNRVGR